mmetsp:Transcript_9010/g.19497  ORF Transcript_9010/g.19497 Transcript_9010/m.19497 type:complete len:95 (+) Transcript_9010:375-659(+)
MEGVLFGVLKRDYVRHVEQSPSGSVNAPVVHDEAGDANFVPNRNSFGKESITTITASSYKGGNRDGRKESLDNLHVSGMVSDTAELNATIEICE